MAILEMMMPAYAAAGGGGPIARLDAAGGAANGAVFGITTASGDMIFVWTFNNASTTIPTLVGGYTNIVGTAGTQQAARLAYKVSTGGDANTGTWTNATNIQSLIYSGASGPGATPTITFGSSTTLSYSAVTLQDTSGSSIILGFGGIKTFVGNSMAGNPTGGTVALINRNNSSGSNCLDSATTAANYTAQTKTVTNTTRWATVTLELKI